MRKERKGRKKRRKKRREIKSIPMREGRKKKGTGSSRSYSIGGRGAKWNILCPGQKIKISGTE